MSKNLLFFLLFPFLLLGQTKQLCFSFDDLPLVSYGINDTVYQQKLMSKLINSLKNNKIPAIGFVNEKKLYTDGKLNQFQVELLKSWVHNGLDLGNHTYSHPDYNNVSLDYFTNDLLKGEKITKKILKSKGKTLKYFRHPYLHVGNTKAKADSLKNYLHQHGYIAAPVSIDNEDYLFALAYKRAQEKDDTDLMLKIGHDYINYMEEKLKYFETEAQSLFGRDIKQILLLHASSLNSDYVDSLAIMCRKNKYEFINMDNALKDEVYKTPITVYGKWGISWLDKWAMSAGKKGDFFKGDPETPEYIKVLSK